MTFFEGLIAIGGAGIAALGGGYGFAQYLIERHDKKKENTEDKKIKDAVDAAKEELRKEFSEGLQKREDTGKKRFEINSKKIDENSEQIGKILTLVESQVDKNDAMLESLTSLNTVTKACAEGVKSTVYDKIFVVAEKAIKRGAITVDEKSNIAQLWASYDVLNGNGKGRTYAKICLEELPIISEEDGNVINLHKS